MKRLGFDENKASAGKAFVFQVASAGPAVVQSRLHSHALSRMKKAIEQTDSVIVHHNMA
jgi:hypothetical protein